MSSLVKLLGFEWAEENYGNQWKVLRHVGTIVSHEGGASYKVRHLEDNLEYIRSKRDLRVHNQAITYHVIDANNRPWVKEGEDKKRGGNNSSHGRGSRSESQWVILTLRVAKNE